MIDAQAFVAQILGDLQSNLRNEAHNAREEIIPIPDNLARFSRTVERMIHATSYAIQRATTPDCVDEPTKRQIQGIIRHLSEAGKQVDRALGMEMGRVRPSVQREGPDQVRLRMEKAAGILDSTRNRLATASP